MSRRPGTMANGASAPAPAANGSSSPSDSDLAQPVTPYDKQKLLLSSDPGHFSLIRALHLADFITELNGFCGVMSIFTSLRYVISLAGVAGAAGATVASGASPETAALNATAYTALGFLPLGLFFDFMDGKVARWRKKSSMMGQELDSLADLISFGVAPAVAAFSIGLRTPLDHLILSFFVLCGLTRLARFNVTTQVIPKDKSGKAAYFEGTPIPTSLALDGLMAYWISQGWIHDAIPLGTLFEGTLFEFHPIGLLFAIHGCLMTSKTIHIPKP